MPKFRPIPSLTPDLIEQFWSKVDKTSDPDGCHLWQGRVNTSGHGMVDFFRHGYLVHRVAYTLMKGPIPEGMTIDHVRALGCQHRNCANPDHLEAVPHRVNVLRGDGPTAINAEKTHCIRGHALTADNLYERSDRPGHRECRQCALDRARATKLARKAAA